MGPLIAAFEDSLSLYVIPAAHAEISKYLQQLKIKEVEIKILKNNHLGPGPASVCQK